MKIFSCAKKHFIFLFILFFINMGCLSPKDNTENEIKKNNVASTKSKHLMLIRKQKEREKVKIVIYDTGQQKFTSSEIYELANKNEIFLEAKYDSKNHDLYYKAAGKIIEGVKCPQKHNPNTCYHRIYRINLLNKKTQFIADTGIVRRIEDFRIFPEEQTATLLYEKDKRSILKKVDFKNNQTLFEKAYPFTSNSENKSLLYNNPFVHSQFLDFTFVEFQDDANHKIPGRGIKTIQINAVEFDTGITQKAEVIPIHDKKNRTDYPVLTLAISPDRRLVSFHCNYQKFETETCIYDLKGNKLAQILSKSDYYNQQAGIWSPDSQKLLLNDSQGKIGYYDLSLSQFIPIQNGPQNISQFISWDPSSQFLIYKESTGIIQSFFIYDFKASKSKRIILENGLYEATREFIWY